MVPVHPGVTLRSQEVRRSEKREKKFPENPDFPDPDPDFRICFHAVAIGAERATCSQNFRLLAALVPEIFGYITIIKYRISNVLLTVLWAGHLFPCCLDLLSLSVFRCVTLNKMHCIVCFGTRFN